MKASTRLLLGAVLVLGLGLAYALFGGSRRTPAGSGPAGGGAPADPGSVEAERVAPLPGAGERSQLGHSGSGAGGGPEDVALLRVSGTVVAAGSGEPVAGATVALEAPDDFVSAETDAGGRFRLALRGDLWRMGETYRATVTRGGTRRLFEGTVVLAPELSLRARLQLVLRGRLVAGFDLSRVATSVRAQVPGSGPDRAAVYAGTGRLDDQGRFEFEAWAEEEPPVFLLDFEALGNRILFVEVPTAELSSGAGATIRCDVGELTFRVSDDDGKPLAEARVCVYCEGTAAESALLQTATDAGGGASLFVPGGRIELCVGREGYSFDLRVLDMPRDLATQALDVVLRPVGLEACVTGRVLDAEGEPVVEAMVSASPKTEHPDVGSAAQVEAPSDEDGNFLLPIAGNAPIEVSAYHARRGKTPSVVLPAGGAGVTLRYQPAVGLEIDLTGVPVEDGQVTGTIQWLMVARGSGRTFSGSAWGLPFEVDEVPAGTYDAYVYLSGPALFAHQSVTVNGEEFQELSIPAQTVALARGTLTRADGSPARSCTVRVTKTDWPDQAVELWGATTTDLQGRFRLPLGPSGRGQASVRNLSGKELGTLELAAGEGTYALP